MCKIKPDIEKIVFRRCDCGAYHLTLGAFTLHLVREELVLLSRTLARVAAKDPVLQSEMVSGILEDELRQRLSTLRAEPAEN